MIGVSIEIDVIIWWYVGPMLFVKYLNFGSSAGDYNVGELGRHVLLIH